MGQVSAVIRFSGAAVSSFSGSRFTVLLEVCTQEQRGSQCVFLPEDGRHVSSDCAVMSGRVDVLLDAAIRNN